MPTLVFAAVLLVGAEVQRQHLDVTLDPAAHTVTLESTLELSGSGSLRLRLSNSLEIDRLVADGRPIEYRKRADGENGERAGAIELEVPPGCDRLTVACHGRFQQDVAAGERPGEIHNFSVDAHIGEEGIFLSEGAAWHPVPIDGQGRSMLHPISVTIAPIEGWAMVASGEPRDEGPLDAPRWHWAMVRPVDGVTIVGNRHQLFGRVHPTPQGPVEVVMHVPDEHAKLAPLFLDAACEYLDLYVPLLGAFPYARFSIVENFFSSGFAYPGFTVLGPQVVGMAPRSLAPGYLDHELVHSWWGNGVYVDPDDGNWCEALTTFCANYYRRIAEEGSEAGRAYRRGVLMKLSSDPDTLDDGALGRFGSADSALGGPDRFVGYDKGAFVFSMLEDVLASRVTADPGTDPMWASLRRFARRNLGRRAGWAELQAAFEAQDPDREAGWLEPYFERWVREHTVPRTIPGEPMLAAEEFPSQFVRLQPVRIDVDPDGSRCEIDPEFRLYRVLPPGQIVPTIAGTLGSAGAVLVTEETRPEVVASRSRVQSDPQGQNLLLIGDAAAARYSGALSLSSDPCSIESDSFTVGGHTYDRPGQALLHTMQRPGEPGRFITVFHSNGDAGWSQLRLIQFYSRDTTIVWEDGQVIERRVFEPSRSIPLK